MMRSIVVLVLLQLSLSWGFGVSPMTSLRPTNAASFQAFKTTQLFADINKDDDDFQPSLPKLQIPPVILKALQTILMFVADVYSVFMIAIGTFFTCGLLLNLCGYGYQLTKEGLRVDTIDQFRLEKQFEQEARRMATEYKPPSSLPQ